MSTYGPDGLNIRALRLEDAEAVAALANGPLAVHGTLQQPYRSVAWRTDWVERAITDADSVNLVAELDGAIIGMAGLHCTSKNPRRKHVAAIGMTVHDDHHGKGIGSALLAELIDVADNWRNIHRIELEVYTDNAAGVRLYEKFGFEIEGTLRDYAFRAGEYVDAYVMSRLRR
jgi:L-phenylalanine/L-methionine N-acetyltransferase